MNDTLNYIPKKQFLQTMGISRYTFRDWVEKRNLPVIRIGYRTFIPFSEYKEWEKKYHKNIPQNSEKNNEFEQSGDTAYLLPRTPLSKMKSSKTAGSTGSGGWLQRLRMHHPSSMLISIASMALSDGLGGMRGLAMQNIFKEKF